MRKFRYILLLAAIFGAVSCVVNDVDYQVNTNQSDVVNVIGRITRFSDHDVTTRGPKDDAEAKMSSMALAIFPVKDDGSGLADNCVYYTYKEATAELLFTIDRASNPALCNYNKPYVMYIFCNMPGMEDIGVGSTLDDMLSVAFNVENIDIPANGFPMIGSLGDTFSTTFNRDDQKFVLSPTDGSGKLLTPTVDGNTRDLLTIPMEAMFVKVNFSIEVAADQSIPDSYAPKFYVDNYTINGIPSTVDFKNNTLAESVLDNKSLGIEGNLEAGPGTVKFTFYLPEQLLSAGKTFEDVLPAALKKSTYSKEVDRDQNGYRDEDEKYHQRYKCKLLGDDQQAANIVISGRYRDHQNHYWNIDYTIYLGENNTDSFNLRRNYEYNNVVTIRGIQNSSDMSANDEAISIDHRVNITRTQPGIITLRRETLLDSHFEVRPLRVRKSEEDVPSINAVKVEVVNPTTTNWMRLERSGGVGTDYANVTNKNGESIYITEEGPSKGKRRYFTYDLCTGTTATNSPLTNSWAVVLPLSDDTECCWIYVDECTEIGDAVRSGVVRVTYGSGTTTDNFVATTDTAFPPVEYVLNQRKLFQVKYDDPKTTADENRVYHIEYEEEYLHNFDADDNFGTTDYEGMQWGLPGVQLSYDTQAMVFSNAWGSDIVNGFVSTLSPYYDFYISTHDSVTGIVMRDKESDTKYPYLGQTFSSEIITTINGGQKDANGESYDKDPDNNIDVLQLNQHPNSAIEYCYNKNKRNAEGHVVWQDGTTYNQSQLNWYLPSINEIEDIMMSKYGSGTNTYARFLDFRNKYYWSSQPAYIRNVGHYVSPENDVTGDYYYDDKDNARATKVSYDGTYHITSSGVDGYYEAAYIRRPVLSGAVNAPLYHPLPGSYQYIGYTWLIFETTKTMSEYDDEKYRMKRHDGNRPRTSMARVRCVRKVN